MKIKIILTLYDEAMRYKKEYLIDFINGRMRKRDLYIYSVIIGGSWYLGLLIAWIFFPGFYSIFNNTISDLGNPNLNPFPGFQIFTITCLITGIGGIPVSLYLYRHIIRYSRRLAKIAFSLNLTSLISLIMIGIFPNTGNVYYIHSIVAFINFLSSFSYILVYWLGLIFYTRRIPKVERFISNTIIILMISILTVNIFLLFYSTISKIIQIGIISTIILRFSFLEWLFLFTGGFQLALIVILVPNVLK
ncbi:MAG: DUF998 domain-containing protein [Candidatus Lokiarchaeota archaeon]|nr:DUF998 domain-containing protein [Candidatus Lokiarchaeota archaeon]